MIELTVNPPALRAEWQRGPDGKREARLYAVDPGAGIVTTLVIAEVAWFALVKQLGGANGVVLPEAADLHALSDEPRDRARETGQ